MAFRFKKPSVFLSTIIVLGLGRLNSEMCLCHILPVCSIESPNSGWHTYCKSCYWNFWRKSSISIPRTLISHSSYLTHAYILTVLICVINVQITVILLTYWLAYINFRMSKTHGCVATSPGSLPRDTWDDQRYRLSMTRWSNISSLCRIRTLLLVK